MLLLPFPHPSRTAQMLRQAKFLGWGRGLCTPAGSLSPYLLACTSMRTAIQVTSLPLKLLQLGCFSLLCSGQVCPSSLLTTARRFCSLSLQSAYQIQLCIDTRLRSVQARLSNRETGIHQPAAHHTISRLCQSCLVNVISQNRQSRKQGSPAKAKPNYRLTP